ANNGHAERSWNRVLILDAALDQIESAEAFGIGRDDVVEMNVFDRSAAADARFDVNRILPARQGAVENAHIADAAGHFGPDCDSAEDARAERAVGDRQIMRRPG